jgi:pimeloyl-ACP methyl ester carboxylesterase
MIPLKLFRSFSQSHCTNLTLKNSAEVSKTWARSISVKRLNMHYLDLGDDRRVAYQAIPGHRQPTVIMIPGLHSYSDMSGQKSACLLRYCDMNDHPCVVYDHECSGKSGGNVENVLFTNWVEDAMAVVNRLTEGPVVLVGSSLGGWLSLITATQLADRLHSLILFAPALNYVWPYYHQHRRALPPEVCSRLEQGDPHVHTHEYGDALIKKDFAADSRKYEIDLEKSLDIRCPVRIIHGLRDREVDPEQSVKLCRSLVSDDVDLIYRKESDHQLEQAPDLELFLITLDRLMKDNPVRQAKCVQSTSILR